MSIKISIRTLLMALIVLVLVFVTANTYVEARINEAEKAMALNTIVVDGGPGFIMVSPMQFRPFEPSDTWAYPNYNLTGASTAQRDFAAGLTLPHGATITRAIVYYQDVATANMGYALYRCSLDSSGCSTMGWGQTLEKSDIYTYKIMDPFTPFKVDNQSYTYMLFVIFNPNSGSDILLSGVRIDYEYTNSLPLVTK